MRVNKKMKKLALRSALTDALQSQKLVLVEEFVFDEPSTREAVTALETLGLIGRILLVLPGPQEVVERSVRNIPYVRVTYSRSLGVYELLAADRVVFTAAALNALEGRAPEGEAPDGSARGGSQPATPEPLGMKAPEGSVSGGSEASRSEAEGAGAESGGAEGASERPPRTESDGADTASEDGEDS
jgi:hypothetical protein